MDSILLLILALILAEVTYFVSIFLSVNGNARFYYPTMIGAAATAALSFAMDMPIWQTACWVITTGLVILTIWEKRKFNRQTQKRGD